MDSRCLLLLGLLPLSPGVMAAEEDSQAPDLALLEFLGSWEDPDGEWIDPLQILDELESEDMPATPSAEERKGTEVENDD